MNINFLVSSKILNTRKCGLGDLVKKSRHTHVRKYPTTYFNVNVGICQRHKNPLEALNALTFYLLSAFKYLPNLRNKTLRLIQYYYELFWDIMYCHL